MIAFKYDSLQSHTLPVISTFAVDVNELDTFCF